VGLPGSGKSTVREILSRRDTRFRFRLPPPKSAYLPFLLKHPHLWVPARLHDISSPLLRFPEEVKYMSYLATFIPHLQKQASGDDAIPILDPGSVFWLFAVCDLHPRISETRAFAAWHRKMIAQWSAALRLLIHLDAPNDILFQRIHARGEFHPWVHDSEISFCNSCDRYRGGLSRVISSILKHRQLPVLRFSTDAVTPSAVADAILSVME
jgi:hypothetical protein